MAKAHKWFGGALVVGGGALAIEAFLTGVAPALAAVPFAVGAVLGEAVLAVTAGGAGALGATSLANRLRGATEPSTATTEEPSAAEDTLAEEITAAEEGL